MQWYNSQFCLYKYPLIPYFFLKTFFKYKGKKFIGSTVGGEWTYMMVTSAGLPSWVPSWEYPPTFLLLIIILFEEPILYTYKISAPFTFWSSTLFIYDWSPLEKWATLKSTCWTWYDHKPVPLFPSNDIFLEIGYQGRTSKRFRRKGFWVI